MAKIEIVEADVIEGRDTFGIFAQTSDGKEFKLNHAFKSGLDAEEACAKVQKVLVINTEYWEELEHGFSLYEFAIKKKK